MVLIFSTNNAHTKVCDSVFCKGCSQYFSAICLILTPSIISGAPLSQGFQWLCNSRVKDFQNKEAIIRQAEPERRKRRV